MKKKLMLLVLAISMLLPLFSGMTFSVSAAQGDAASIGDTGYATLEAAIAAAGDNDTVTLLRDISISSTVQISKKLTLNGAGHTVSSTAAGYALEVQAGGDVTVKRLTILAPNGGGIAVSGRLDLGVLGDPDEGVIIRAKGSDTTWASSDAPVYIAGSSIFNAYYAELTGLLRCISIPGAFDSTVKIYDGRYEVTCEEKDCADPGSAGRIINFFGGRCQFDIYGGRFISSYGGFILNVVGSSDTADDDWCSEINIHGGYYCHSGKSGGVPYIQAGAKNTLNIYGGLFDIKSYTSPIYAILQSTINGYGGTVICEAMQKLSASTGFRNYGMTLINHVTGADIDMTDARPVLRAGASISLDPNNAGIRFSAVMPAHAVATLGGIKDSGTELSYGMLIAPTSKLATDITLLNFDMIAALGLEPDRDYVDIAAQAEPDAKGNYKFSAALTGIDKRYFGIDYTAAPYVKYIKNGETVYLFGNFSDANTRNMKDIATRALADNNTYGRNYNESQLTALRNYASAESVSAVTSVVRVLSLNILAHNPSDKPSYYNAIYSGQSFSDYTFDKRVQYFNATVNYALPDVMLLQEFSGKSFWGAESALNIKGSNGRYTSSHLPNYEWVAYKNRNGNLYENENDTNPFAAYNFVVYNTDKFTLAEGEYASGTRFVSKSGNRTAAVTDLKDNTSSGAQGSYYEDLGDFTWVVLVDNKTGQKSIYASLHTYNKNQTQRYAYYLENLQCVTEFLEDVSARYDNAPVTFGGDLNMWLYGELFSQHYSHITEVANYRDAKVTGSNYGTNRDFGTGAVAAAGSSQHGTRIDYIFVNGADTYGYEVMAGHIVNGAYDPYAKLGTGYDVSDHSPVITNVVISSENSFKAQTKANYSNPNAGENALANASGSGSKATKVLFNDSSILSAFASADPKYGAQYMKAEIVSDADKGNVVRIAATDETNYVNFAFNYGSLYTTAVSGYSKVRITFRTELTYEAKLLFCASTSNVLTDGTNVEIPVTSNGEWQTIDLSVASKNGNFTKFGIWGSYDTTGLLCGDAIYIASIELLH